MLGKFGIKTFASALMYVLKELFMLDEGLMLCAPDEKRGKKLYNEILNGGNFGWFRKDRKNGNLSRPLERKIHSMKLSSLYPRESHWYMLYSMGNFFSKLPQRIKYRTWSLQTIKKEKQ
jgi:hypothetical protein